MLTPFTFEEATEIKEDFEDLIDTEFTLDSGVEYFVHDLVICPFPETDRDKFTALYTGLNDKQPALNAYTGDNYDVLIAACNTDDESEYRFIGIRTFIADKGISYNFPETQHGH